MSNHLLKRILLFLPAMVIILLFTMVLGKYSGEIPPDFYNSEGKYDRSQEAIEDYKKRAGLSEPFFYLSINHLDLGPVILPRVSWNGTMNRFHRYVGNILNGSMGYSEYRNMDVWQILKYPFFRTLFINAIVLIISYGLGLYLGYFQALNKIPWLSKILSFISQFFYAFPAFWLAILLLWGFSNNQNFYIFPTRGWNWDISLGWFQATLNLLWHLVLPIICLSIGSIAYIAALFHDKIETEINKPYYSALIARGLSNEKIIKRHIFKIALIPVIATSIDLLPSLISGSIIIESIFGIPGMGKLAFDAFLTRDLSVIYALTLLSATLTWINWLVADYLFVKLDPRVEF